MSKRAGDQESSNPLASYKKFAPAVAEVIELLEYLVKTAKKESDKLARDRSYNRDRHDDLEEVCFALGSDSGAKVCYCPSVHVEVTDWERSIWFLTERLQAIFMPRHAVPSLMEGRAGPEPEKGLGEGLFESFSLILGFYNFILSDEDNEDYSDSEDDRLYMDAYLQLSEKMTLSEQQWRGLREYAATRASLRLDTYLFDGGHNPSRPWEKIPYKRSYNNFYLTRQYSSEELPVDQVAQGEERRLRKFAAALHGTLRVLEGVRDICKITTPPTDMISFLRTLRSVLNGSAGINALLVYTPGWQEEMRRKYKDTKGELPERYGTHTRRDVKKQVSSSTVDQETADLFMRADVLIQEIQLYLGEESIVTGTGEKSDTELKAKTRDQLTRLYSRARSGEL